MRRFSSLATLTVLLGALSTSAWSHADGSHVDSVGEVVTGALNVRTGPSTQHPPIGVVRGGDRVDILALEGDWYRIRAGGLVGWAHAGYIDTYAGTGPVQDHRSRDRDLRGDHRHGPRFAFVGASRLGHVSVFAGPGRRHALIGRLATGERVQAIEPGERWTLIGKRGLGHGYVRSGSLVRI